MLRAPRRARSASVASWVLGLALASPICAQQWQQLAGRSRSGIVELRQAALDAGSDALVLLVASHPDDRYLLGETPEVRNLFVAAGFNSIGIQSAGGAGKVLADWMLDGHPPMDLWDVDIRRAMPFQRNKRYLHDRTVETLGLLYDMHWPFRQPATARGVRRSPLHDRLAALGACFGETAGWERANWFAEPGSQPQYEYSYGRQNWFAHSAAEHMAVRQGVGLSLLRAPGIYAADREGHPRERLLAGRPVLRAEDTPLFSVWMYLIRGSWP